MSIGLQVIASNTGANPELIENGVNGYIYNHKNIEDLAFRILQIYNSSVEERQTMSDNAKKQAQLFTDKIHAGKIYDFYRNILDKK